MPVRKCLLMPLAAALALALAACTQQAEPEELLEPVSPVVEDAAPEAKPQKKPRRPGRKKPRREKPAEAEVALPAVEAVVESPVSAPEPAPVIRPVVLDSPFVPSAPGKRIAQVSVPGPYVAVTFDDGPSAELTPRVLDIFKRHGAHATFFVLGRNAVRNRSLLARAVAEGHEVGAHTWSHINMRASSQSFIKKELDRTNAVIEEATGKYPKVMRPPYGSANKQIIDMVYNRYGTPAILWDVDTNDWRKPGVQAVVNRAVNKARPGSIILLHDIHASTLEAVEDIVIGLQARGFKLVTVSELIDMGRRAAGASAPAQEPEASTPEENAPAVSPEADAAPLHAQQQQQAQPEGADPIGTAPAPAEPLPAPVPETALPQEQEFHFYES